MSSFLSSPDSTINRMIAVEARRFAESAHGKQKYGSRPYLYHLDQVYDLAKDYGPYPFTLAVAYLHDVVEDTGVSLGVIEERFGGIVADNVELVTDSPGDSRKEKKEKTNAKLAQVSAEKSYLQAALIVKACDRLANVLNCLENNPKKLEMYRKEHKAFRKAAHRPGLCDEIWEQLDEALEDKV